MKMTFFLTGQHNYYDSVKRVIKNDNSVNAQKTQSKKSNYLSQLIFCFTKPLSIKVTDAGLMQVFIKR